MNGRRLIVRSIAVADTYPLRGRVLRPHLGGTNMPFEGDELAGATHFGAFLVDGAASDGGGGVPVGVGSAMPVDFEGERAIQIRGMAVAEDLRGGGVGAALLDALLDHAREIGAAVAWCNARVVAESLYARFGFRRVSEPWDSQPLGFHVRMMRRLDRD